MPPLGLHFSDWLTLVLYLFLVMAVGLYTNRKIKLTVWLAQVGAR